MGYRSPPWIFKGRAVYQLNLVKVDQARKFVPGHLNLVSLFGYTLGGLYLARYTDSPAGAFDEVVLLAGLVWNFPTSCAWAARVYVNNREARDHGRSAIGLPSCQAAMDACVPPSGSVQDQTPSWWTPHSGALERQQRPQSCTISLQNLERRRWWHRRPQAYSKEEGVVCQLGLPALSPGVRFQGLPLRLCLPSFSGATPFVPDILQYTCRLSARILPVEPVHVRVPKVFNRNGCKTAENDRAVLQSILTGRPVVALAFNEMVMSVETPVPLHSQGAAQCTLVAA